MATPDGKGKRAPTYTRDDFNVINGRGLRVACSLWRPEHDSEITQMVAGPLATGLLRQGELPLSHSPSPRHARVPWRSFQGGTRLRFDSIRFDRARP